MSTILFEKDASINLRAARQKDAPLRPERTSPRKALQPFVQASERERFGFKRIPIDGKWLYVYADHIRFLTPKRHRVDGVRVQGYTTKTVQLEVHHA